MARRETVEIEDLLPLSTHARRSLEESLREQRSPKGRRPKTTFAPFSPLETLAPGSADIDEPALWKFYRRLSKAANSPRQSECIKALLETAFGLYASLPKDKIDQQLRDQLELILGIKTLNLFTQPSLINPADQRAENIFSQAGMRPLPVLLVSPSPMPSNLEVAAYGLEEEGEVIAIATNGSSNFYPHYFALGRLSDETFYLDPLHSKRIIFNKSPQAGSDRLRHQSYLAFWLLPQRDFEFTPFQAVLTTVV